MAEHVAPTQVVHPWRAALRTFVQVIVPALLLVLTVGPEVLEIIATQLKGQVPEGFYSWLIAASLFLATLASILARIMAIPQVNALLGKLKLDAGK